MVQGVDLYHGNVITDWHALASKASFVWLKVTQGSYYQDTKTQEYHDAARSVGMKVGGYHFYGGKGTSPEAEATYFTNRYKAVGTWDIRPVLDAEAVYGSGGKLVAPPPSEDWCYRFLVAVEKTLGVTPILYASESLLDHVYNTPRLLRFGKWVAHYNGQPGNVTVPNWVAHQYGGGPMPGAARPIDLDFAPDIKPLLIAAPTLPIQPRPKPPAPPTTSPQEQPMFFVARKGTVWLIVPGGKVGMSNPTEYADTAARMKAAGFTNTRYINGDDVAGVSNAWSFIDNLPHLA